MEILQQIIDHITNSEDKTIYFIIGGFILVVAMVVMRELLFFLIIATVAAVIYLVFVGDDIDTSSLPDIPNMEDDSSPLDGIKDKYSDYMQQLEDFKDSFSGAEESLELLKNFKEEPQLDQDLEKAIKQLQEQSQ